MPEHDGGQQAGAFPATPWSSILNAAEADTEERRKALRGLLASYWKPVYCSVRFGRNLDPAAARDVVLAFFARLLDEDVLLGLDPGQGRFRDFLKHELDRFLAEQSPARPHGGEPIDFALDGAESLETEPGEPLEVFDREWLRLLFRRALRRLEKRLDEGGEDLTWTIFRRRDVEGDSRPLAELAADLEISSEEARSRLLDGRRLLRRIVIDQVHEYALDEQDAREELSWTLG